MSILIHGIVSQGGLIPAASIDPTSINASNDGGNYTFDVISNVDWEIEERSAYDWISLSALTGSAGTTEITATVSARSTAGAARTGYIDVSVPPDSTASVSITQPICVAPVFNIFVADGETWTISGASATGSLGGTSIFYAFTPSNFHASDDDVFIDVSGDQSTTTDDLARNGVQCSGTITLTNPISCGDVYYISLTDNLPL